MNEEEEDSGWPEALLFLAGVAAMLLVVAYLVRWGL